MTTNYSSTQDSRRVQVEVSVQDYFNDFLPVKLTSNQDNIERIPAKTWEDWFQCWVEILQTELPVASGYELSLRLTNDAEIQALNAQYRQQNQPTDVLAFAALETEFPDLTEIIVHPLYLGDIVISVDTAEQQAIQQGHSLKTELAWLAAHGLLHLMGWDHPDDDRLNQMLNQQVSLLQKVGIAITQQNYG